MPAIAQFVCAAVSLAPTAELPSPAFRLVMPSAEPPRAILVLVPGSHSDGRGLADDPAWREWAGQHRLAIVSCFFQDPPSAEEGWIEQYTRADRGSGQALLEGISRLAEEIGRPEIASLPLALVGISAGGQFAYEFTCWRPERVLAFVAHKGGVYFTHLAPRQAREVPGLFLIGEKDLIHRRLSLTGVWSSGRRAGAHWALVDEPGTGHEEVACASLARTFLDDCLALRLAGPQLQPAQTCDGWLIGCALKSPCQEPQDPLGPATTGWLPGRLSAEATQPFAPKF